MFHLFTHAFFKALLFLGAGSVIHGMHHEQDMRKMGGLAKFMPLTYAAMMIGTIAIIGLGVPHTKLGFAGFFSKDAILESAFASGMEHVAFRPDGLLVRYRRGLPDKLLFLAPHLHDVPWTEGIGRCS
jgi:NADH-quinone oxidoreductase subunit L